MWYITDENAYERKTNLNIIILNNFHFFPESLYHLDNHIFGA